MNTNMNRISLFRDEYMFLSNFYPCRVTYEGLTYQCSESAYQAQKSRYHLGREVFTQYDGKTAKAQSKRIRLREDWEDVKVDIMHDLVYQKFTENPDLGQKLLDTGDAYLEEGNFWGDRFWGRVDGSGENKLGLILMLVRRELQEESRSSNG